MRLLRRITLAMRAGHSSPANTAVSLEPRHFGTLSRSGSNLSQQNCEGGYGSRVRYLKKRGLIWLCKQFRNSLVSNPPRGLDEPQPVLGSRLSPPRKPSEGETTTDCRSKVAVVEIGDAGAVRNGDGQTAGHEGIRKPGKTVEAFGEVMIRID